jgi:hypothetical protein
LTRKKKKMTETLNKIVVDCSTGEQTIVPLTAEEIAQREADAQAYLAQKAIEDAAAEALATLKASAKAKLIAGEPLTAEEADTLVI